MRIKEFIDRLAKLHFSLGVENGSLVLEGDEDKLSNAELEAIKDNHEIINFIKSHRDELMAWIGESKEKPTNESADISSMYKLSGLQEGMLFHSLFDGQAGSYIEQLDCEMTNVDIASFKKSWDYIFKHHSILRSSFHHEEFSIPVQCVHTAVEVPITVLDYRHIARQDQHKVLEEYRTGDRNKGFDFTVAPLMRLTLIQIDDDRYWMLWTFHHILIDGWSQPVLLNKFLQAYEIIVSGRQLPVTEEDRYEDYIRYISTHNKEEEESFWRGYMRGLETATLLPFVDLTSYRNKGIGLYQDAYLRLNSSLTEKIKSFGQRHHLTINTIIQGVWSYLLHCYTGNSNIAYGVTVAGRPENLKGVEHRIGLYINTLPLHSGNPRGRNKIEWLRSIQTGQIECRECQYTPLYNIQRWTSIPGDLFDSIVVFENYPVGEAISVAPDAMSINKVNVREQTNYPLSISVAIAAELSISFSYNTNLLEEGYINLIRGHFEHVLLQVINESKIGVNDIVLLTEMEKKHIHGVFNNTQTKYHVAKTLVDLFVEQVRDKPQQIAVEFQHEKLTYKELHDKSTQLAHYLKRAGSCEGSFIAICMDQGVQMIIAILGVLKTGAAYVPIDPNYPSDRITYMITDCECEIIIVNSRTTNRITTGQGETVIDLDAQWPKIEREPIENPVGTFTSTSLAYVIYTSGSTGSPKGVMVEHCGIVNLISHQTITYGIQNGERILQFYNYSFDASVEQIFLALSNGGVLVLLPKDVQMDFEFFGQFLEDQRITHLDVTPSFLQQLAPGKYSALKRVVCGGETCKKDLAEQWSRLVDFYNVYGPTESSITSVSYKCEYSSLKGMSLLPIGRPISNTFIYIIDELGDLVPVGVPGELCIGGTGVTRGYWMNPDLTSKKFVPNVYDEKCDRLYKTGDVAKWLPDGNIEFLERKDQQVKIRGYRIELTEIENVLQNSNMVKQAVVVTRPDINGLQRIVSYVVPQGEFDKTDIERYLKDKLPSYMVPSQYVVIDNIPLTPNGKINHKLLPEPVINKTNNHLAPSTEIENKLTEIWSNVLEIDREVIGVNSNFFELGGHSISIMKLCKKINEEFQCKISVPHMFRLPTISAIAELIISGDKHVTRISQNIDEALNEATDNLKLLNDLSNQNG